MLKKLTFEKTIKLIFLLMFLLYLVVLVQKVLLKDGMALTFAEVNNELSFEQRLAGVNFLPFKTIMIYLGGQESFRIAAENLLGNIIAFAPMGFLLPIIIKKCRKALNIFIVSISASLLIEILQFFFHLGSTDVDDVILNVSGALLGYYTYKVIVLLKERYVGREQL
jgi:glycopeptide antibiotics resistance protein